MGEVGDSERAAYASTFGPFPAGRSSVSLVDFPRSQPLILRARALQLLLTPIFSIPIRTAFIWPLSMHVRHPTIDTRGPLRPGESRAKANPDSI